MYVCMCVFARSCVSIHIYIYIHTHIRVPPERTEFARRGKSTLSATFYSGVRLIFIHMYIHVCRYVFVFARSCVSIHIYIYIHTHTRVKPERTGSPGGQKRLGLIRRSILGCASSQAVAVQSSGRRAQVQGVASSYGRR